MARLVSLFLAMVFAMAPLSPLGASGEKVFGYAGAEKGDFGGVLKIGGLLSATLRSHVLPVGAVVRPGSLSGESLATIQAAGVAVNTVTLAWEDASQVAWHNKRGRLPILVGDLLFFQVRPEIDGPCKPWTMTLRPDWTVRADWFLARHGKIVEPGRIAGLAILSESNNACVAPETLGLVARYLVERGVDRSLLGTGNATSNGSQPLLPWFPGELGWVAVFDYDLADLGPDSEGIEELKERLSRDQDYILVPRGFLFPWELETVAPWRLAAGVEEYARYCAGDLRCRGITVFLWKTVESSPIDGGATLYGTDGMPGAWAGHARASDILLRP